VIQCPTCKQVLQPGIRFCPHDGTPLTETSAQTVRTPTGAKAAEAKELQLPVIVGGRYRLVEFRGGGGMAKVYRGQDVTLEREVAVKLINPELRTDAEFDARFQREARIASQLADPHIVVVHDFGIDPEHGPFLVMEYLQGQSLRERLLTQGPLPFKAGLQLSAQLMLALIHAHGKNIIHRDIKPDNVFLLNQSGVRLHVRMLDFGIARIYHRDDPTRAETLTSPGAVLGTPRYMSPEQLAGESVEARSDLYSAALVVHESITGQLPYVSGKRLCELCPEATAALQELLDQCLKPNPAERPPSAVEVYLRLQELGKASGILLLPPGAMDRLIAARQQGEPTVAYRAADEEARARRRRRRWMIGIALLLAVLGLGVLTKYLFFSPRTPSSGAESLLGYKIGDPGPAVVEGLKLFQGGPLNPWSQDPPPAYVGLVLKAENLRVPPDELNRLDVRRTNDERVCVILADGKVRAIVVRDPHQAATARGVHMGASGGQVLDAYPETESDVVKVPARGGTPAHKIEVRRSDALGIGFEIDRSTNRVTAITLYPAAPQ
jgi:hypothetical protein